MSCLALALVLSAAVAHATWNLLAKRVGGGAPFLWLVSALTVVVYAPFALGVAVVRRVDIGPAALAFMVGSAFLHIAYFLLLQHGYRVGDLSLVYPLARGTGPTLSTIAAIVLLGERPSPLALAGALLVVVSVFVLAGGSSGAGSVGNRAALGYGLLCGVAIASYTVWDAHAVAVLLVPPLVLDWGNNVVRMGLLAPVASRRRGEVRRHWRVHRREALGVAVPSPLSYVLVLTALVFTPVSYVAPAREVSILIGTVMGARLLAEGDAPRRLAAAGGIVVGVAALAVG